jgi:hypothetical protein
MLVAYRLAGLSAPEAYYAGIMALAQSGACGCATAARLHVADPLKPI